MVNLIRSLCSSLPNVVIYAVTLWAVVKGLELLLGLYTFNKGMSLQKELYNKPVKKRKVK